MLINYPEEGESSSWPDESLDASIAASLLLLDQLLIELMGGLFSERANGFRGFIRVLDVTGGSGTWVLQAARANPRVEFFVTGPWKELTEYTRSRARAQGIDNVQVVPLPETLIHLPFPDKHFDLVNGQCLFPLLRVEQWPAFLQECWRVTHPGGYVRLTEPEWGMTSSWALERLGHLFLRALQQRGQTLSPDGQHLGVITWLSFFLEEAGWKKVTRRAYVADYGQGPQLPRDPARRMKLLARELRPVILQQGVATPQEVEHLVLQATSEMGRHDFCGIQVFLSVCGRKPTIRATSVKRFSKETEL